MAVRDVQLERTRVRALRETDIVDVARQGQARANLRRGLGIDTPRDPVVARQLQPENEIAPGEVPHRFDELKHETHAVLKAAAIRIGALVRIGRHELVKQVTMTRR